MVRDKAVRADAHENTVHNDQSDDCSLKEFILDNRAAERSDVMFIACRVCLLAY
jgi:hypothetical protein